MQSFSEPFVSDLASVIFDGLIVHDGKSVLEANDRAARIFGYDSGDSMIGVPYLTLLAPDGRRDVETRISAGTEGRYSAFCRNRDGTDFAVDVNVREILRNGLRARLVAFRYSADHGELGDAFIQRSVAFDQAVQALATTIEQRDSFTAGHQNRVSYLATRVAEMLGMSEREITTIKIAGNIHDIGKVSVPAEILMKPSKLSTQEYNLIKIHPEAGQAIVKGIDFDGPVSDIILQHHERLDGSGYPLGIQDPIPPARVIAVADVYDALTSSRPYRAGMTPEKAINLMRDKEGRRLDALALDTLTSLVLH